MSTARKVLAIAFAGLIASTGAVFAQVGGSDVPKDAKKQGEMEQPGSTGMKKGGMKKESGMMKKDDGMMKKDKM